VKRKGENKRAIENQTKRGKDNKTISQIKIKIKRSK
jgi:hypothetical protein